MRRKSILNINKELKGFSISKPTHHIRKNKVTCYRKGALVISSILSLAGLLMIVKENKRNEQVTDQEIQKVMNLQKEWVGSYKSEIKTKLLLYSTWRSGSSFIGGLFESHPGNMFWIIG